MPSLRVEGVVPLPLADVWRLLHLHLDPDTVRAIHPWILRERVVRDEGEQGYGGLVFPDRHVMERDIRLAGRTLHNTWTYRIAPPITFGYDVRGAAGVASFTNSYREEGRDTRIVTEGSVDLGRVPGFLQRRIVGRLLARADDDDLAYVRRYGFQTIGDATRPKGT